MNELIELRLLLIDLVRWVCAPPILLACLTVIVTAASLLAARRCLTHPDPWRRWPPLLFAAILLLQLPARTDAPSALGRVLTNLALTLLLIGLARPVRGTKEKPND